MNEVNIDLVESNPVDRNRPIPLTPKRASNVKPDFNKKEEVVSNVESGEGTEVIIYETPQELPENSNFHIVIYIFMQVGSDLLAKIIIGALIISTYSPGHSSFAPLALFIVIYQFYKIGFNLFFFIAYRNRVPEFNKVYIFDIILSIGYIVMFFALYEYFKGNLPASSLPMFVVPHIILTLIRFCAGEAMNTPYLPSSGLAFFESLQILYIALKLASPDSHANWTWVLMFYYVLTILFLILAFILMIVLVIFVFMIIFESEVIREMPNLVKFLACGILFYVVWNGIIFYYLLSGFHFLLEANQIGPKGISGEMNPRLLYISWFMIICATITLILMFILYCYLKEALLNFFNKDKAKEISLQSFAKNLNLNMKQVSGNYFKKQGSGDEENPQNRMKESGAPQNLDTCLVCCEKQSDIMIHPCGHSGTCQDCLKDYLKDKDVCPMCREKIDKVYLIFYDQEKKTYLAKGVIKIKR